MAPPERPVGFQTPTATLADVVVDSSERTVEGTQPAKRTTAFRLSTFWRELSTFGVIGVINAIIDLGLFNLLINGPLDGKVTTAKFISGGVATIFAWIGNRYWTFRDRTNRPVHHEVILFFLVNGIALLATTAWVAFAHYVLHAHGSAWLNFHAILGIGIGTVIRFVAYRTFVFGASAEQPTN